MSEVKVKGKNNKFTYDSVKQFIEVESNSGCILISKSYLGTRGTLRIKCSCGNNFKTMFGDFKNKNIRKCSECIIGGGKIYKDWTFTEKREFIESQNITSCTLVKSNSGYSSSTTLQCQCGSFYTWRFDVFVSRKKYICQDCINRDNFNTIKSFVESCGCKLVSKKYKEAKYHLEYICECGRHFKTSYNAFKNMNQRRCKICRNARSLGEQKIYNFLEKINIEFKEEYSTIYCQNVLPLLFDFAILDANKKILLFIEYDGKQHFEPVDFAGNGMLWAQSKFDTQVENDNIKNQYCKDNNIPLLRIPYWDFDNIEEILECSLNINIE